MKINDKDLYIKLPVESESFVTLPNSFGLDYTLFDRDDITDLGTNALRFVNYNQKLVITNFSMPNLTTISGEDALTNAFQGCTSLSSVNLPNLTTITGHTALQEAFSGCTSLTSVDLSSLATITGNIALVDTFDNCTSLTSLSFPSLNSNSFGSYGYRGQFLQMLSGVTGCTVHFPSNLESVIGTEDDVTNGFGGTNTNVLFDLPATT